MNRLFATSPQPNPFNSTIQKLSVGNDTFSYFNLPALKDQRIRKKSSCLSFFRKVAIFNKDFVGVSCEKLRRVQCYLSRCRKDLGLGQQLIERRRDSIQTCQSYSSRLHVNRIIKLLLTSSR